MYSISENIYELTIVDWKAKNNLILTKLSNTMNDYPSLLIIVRFALFKRVVH